MAAAARQADPAPHLPVLIGPILSHVTAQGLWVDGTFGAGGYTRAFLAAGAQVIGIDRDPLAFEMADWAEGEPNLTLKQGTFSELDTLAGEPVDGVVLDLGVSSMQLDQAERGFSFMHDGPLDMRMSQSGLSAKDLVNEATEAELADIIFQYGEERASRRIAAAMIKARPIETTGQLAEIIQSVLPRSKPGQSHPATRCFQAIRIAVNDEFGQLISGLEAAERALKPNGELAVVTFHSLEDRIVKRFLQARAGRQGGGSRHAPHTEQDAPTFELITKKAVTADKDELSENPRSRSAKLRVARRTDQPVKEQGRAGLGLPKLSLKEAGK